MEMKSSFCWGSVLPNLLFWHFVIVHILKNVLFATVLTPPENFRYVLINQLGWKIYPQIYLQNIFAMPKKGKSGNVTWSFEIDYSWSSRANSRYINVFQKKKAERTSWRLNACWLVFLVTIALFTKYLWLDYK